MRLPTSILILLVAGDGATVPEAMAQAIPDGPTDWDRPAAAQYLDDRINLWFERASELRTGDGKTTCISCHTVVPYLLARPALRKAMHVNDPTVPEVTLWKEMARRVDTYPDHESMSDAKHGGEHATEAVLNGLILAWHDANEMRRQPTEHTRKAFQQLWETQGADGAWDWMNFGEEPDETADAKYCGAALAAIAVGAIPGLLESGEATDYVDKLRSYLSGKFAEQNLYRRTWMLLASTRLAGLLNRDQRESLITELRKKQNSDGGWSLYRLGPWRWSNAIAPFGPPGNPDPSQFEKSDGYATGLIAYYCPTGAGKHSSSTSGFDR
jgi:squalene-hopene/tetraprenyl-beta-curcumene cyclase